MKRVSGKRSDIKSLRPRLECPVCEEERGGLYFDGERCHFCDWPSPIKIPTQLTDEQRAGYGIPMAALVIALRREEKWKRAAKGVRSRHK